MTAAGHSVTGRCLVVDWVRSCLLPVGDTQNEQILRIQSTTTYHNNYQQYLLQKTNTMVKPEWTEAFSLIDENGTGTIPTTKFAQAVRCAGGYPTEENVKDMVSWIFSTNKTKEVCFTK